MASRRDLLERRPSARPTTRRSFGSTIRAQLPDGDQGKVSTPEASPENAQIRSVLKRPTQLAPVPPPASQKRAHVEAIREETSSESYAPTPKRSRGTLPEEERLVREQDTEYQEEASKGKSQSDESSKKDTSKRKQKKSRSKVSTMAVVLTAVMTQVEQFMYFAIHSSSIGHAGVERLDLTPCRSIEDLTRDGKAIGTFREELASAMAEEGEVLEVGSALKADSARLTREKRRIRAEILEAKRMRSSAQARIAQLNTQAEKLRTQMHQLEALHGLVTDVTDLQEIGAENAATGVTASKVAHERSLTLSVPHLLAMLQETARSVDYLRGINATLAMCLERLDEQ